MKTLHLIGWLALFSAANGAALADQDAIVEQIHEQTAALKTLGFPGFFSWAKEKQLSAPTIRSNWAVERAKPPEHARLEAAGAFANDLALVLENVGQRAQTGKNADADRSLCTALFDFADWISAGRGYGNALLAEQSFDLGLLPAGRLAITSATSPADLSSLLSRLEPDWMGPSYRAAVLNGEVGREIFDGKSHDAIRRVWDCAVCAKLLSRHTGPPDPSIPDYYAALRQIYPDEERARAISDADLQSLTEERPAPNPPTTANLIKANHLLQLVLGLSPQQTDNIRCLVLFRLKVGKFPTTPNGPNSFVPGLEGAFYESWVAYLKTAGNVSERDNKVGLGAWYAYDAVLTRQFSDGDSRSKMDLSGSYPLDPNSAKADPPPAMKTP